MSGRLRQLDLVGRGGMAEVYRGLLTGERGTRRPVAIKRLRPELAADPAAMELFVHEAQLAVGLSHPGLVQALELVRDEQGYALVCEWLDCVSVAALCERYGPLPWPAATHVGRSIAAALAYLHGLASGAIVHRDVCPANVLVVRGGHVKLADLGVASCATRPPLVSARRVGTAGFLAPELAHGAEPDARTDVFAAAATLRAVTADPPPELLAVMCRATAADPRERLDSAARLESELAAVAGSRGEEASAPALARWLEEHDATPSTTRPPSLDGAVSAILAPALAGDGAPVAAPSRERRLGFAVAGLTVLAAVAVAAVLVERRLAQPAPAGPDADAASAGGTVQGAANAGGPEMGSASRAGSTPPEAVRQDGAAREAVSAPRQPPASLSPAPPGAASAPAGTGARAAGAGAASGDSSRAPSARERPRGSARVSLNAVPWASVAIDGRPVGNTPLRAVRLSAGTHTVRLVHPPRGLTREIVVRVEPDVDQTLLVDLRRGTVDRRVGR